MYTVQIVQRVRVYIPEALQQSSRFDILASITLSMAGGVCTFPAGCFLYYYYNRKEETSSPLLRPSRLGVPQQEKEALSPAGAAKGRAGGGTPATPARQRRERQRRERAERKEAAAAAAAAGAGAAAGRGGKEKKPRCGVRCAVGTGSV